MSLSKASIKVGDTHSAVVVDNLTRTQIVQYAGASGDYNPLHTDEIYATKVAGFPTVFAHGMLTMGLTARLVTDWVGDGRLLTLGSRFERQVRRHADGDGDGRRNRGGRRRAGRTAVDRDGQPGRRPGAVRDGQRPPRSLRRPRSVTPRHVGVPAR